MLGDTRTTLYVCARHDWHDTRPCDDCRNPRATDRAELEALRAIEKAARDWDNFILTHGTIAINKSPSLSARNDLLHKRLHDALAAAPAERRGAHDSCRLRSGE